MATKWEFEYAAVGLGMPAVEKLSIEDLLDFTNHELLLSSSSSSSAVTDTTNKLLSEPQLTASATAGGGGGGGGLELEYNYPCRASFADDIYIPRDEVAELEWLSHFVEDSFSDIPVQSPPSNPAVQTTTSHRPNTPSSCRGARSKRSRVLPTESNNMPRSPPPSTTSSSSSSDFTALTDGATRRCTHCASEKTPQWRTGPFGPKTLCNACGVRYKSGRLVPEYRPAASPTFLLTQHSNSHRKVLELRRQKELHVRYNDNGAPSATAKMTEMLLRDYDVC